MGSHWPRVVSKTRLLIATPVVLYRLEKSSLKVSSLMLASELPISVRSVDAGDLPAVANFIEPFVAEGKLLPRTTEELEDLLPHGFIAEQDGRIVGFAALEIYSPKMSEIRSLAVAPEVRGQGIGRQLVGRCVERARERKVYLPPRPLSRLTHADPVCDMVRPPRIVRHKSPTSDLL